MRRAAALLLAVLAARLGAVAFPPTVAGMLPQLDAAERRLQGATLAHEAARREAQPEQEAVAEARAGADRWLGQWRLRRALGRLKARLDAVESARVERDAARQELFLLLTGAEEELRGALEKALGGPKGAAPLAEWWRQEQAWSGRLEALELAKDEAPGEGGKAKALLAQARLEQLQRDQALLQGLARRGVLPPGELRRERARLDSTQKQWKRLAEAAAP